MTAAAILAPIEELYARVICGVVGVAILLLSLAPIPCFRMGHEVQITRNRIRVRNPSQWAEPATVDPYGLGECSVASIAYLDADAESGTVCLCDRSGRVILDFGYAIWDGRPLRRIAGALAKLGIRNRGVFGPALMDARDVTSAIRALDDVTLAQGEDSFARRPSY